MSVAKSWSLVEKLQVSETEVMSSLLQRHVERFHSVEPTISAFVSEPKREERTRAEVEVVKQRFANEDKPTLFGIPIAVKDVFHCEGLPTAAGSQLPTSILTGAEGSLIRRLRELGMWVAGKTVTEAFAYAGPIATRNPHALDRTPGGSSAGSAASVASGICPIALGTQTLRSVAAPASFCGVTGFKPSYGRVSLDGVVLLAPTMDTLGIFTADVTSMHIAASHMIPNWQTKNFTNQLRGSSLKPVLGIPEGVYMKLMGDDIREAFDRQVATLEQAGYTIRFVSMPWQDELIYGDALLRLVQGEMAREHAGWFDDHRTSYGEVLEQAIVAGELIPDAELAQYRAEQPILRQALMDTMQEEGIDLWISPSQGGVAPPYGQRTGWPGMTAIWTYAGLPTISLPGGQVDGLPLGFQCVGGYEQDELLLHHTQQIASLLQR